MVSVISIVGGGVCVWFKVAMGAYTGRLIVCIGGSVADVLAVQICVVMAGQESVAPDDDSKFVVDVDELGTSVFVEVV